MNLYFVRAWTRIGTSLLLTLCACAQPNAAETRVRTDTPASTAVEPGGGGGSYVGGSTSSQTPQLPNASGGAPILGQSGASGAITSAAGGATGTATQTSPTCGSVQIGSELKTTETVIEVPGTVLFVFDQSSSMNEDWNGTPKWSVANAALVAAFAPLQGKLSAGAVLFPTPSADTSTDRCNWLVDWRSCVAAGSS
ncbi:MAG TPA: hypothetical protein VFQ61_08800, partial [Polyangiaceae bacterium]|nr:hypothetical protein [Polyangiaceae bacterium]